MRSKLIVLLLLCGIITASAQPEKSATQVGISALPVFDVLNLFPKNKIYGYGAMANLSYFPRKKLSIGINPYIAEVSNSYPTYSRSFGNFRKEEKLTLLGLNAMLRYYFTKGKFAFYPMVSAGFGNLKINSFKQDTHTELENKSTSVISIIAGAGMNYFIREKIALEINLPFTSIRQTRDTRGKDLSFQTLAPTLGIQFFFQ